MAGAPRILTLDIGSSSVRARLYDERLRSIPTAPAAARPYRWRIADGAMEVGAAELLAEVVAVVDAGVAAARENGDWIAAVAIASFWHGILGLDSAGDPVTPLYGWGDTRAASETPELHARLDPESYHQRTGCFLHTSYPAARILWLRRSDPATFARVAGWASFGELLESQFFGARRCSVSIASGSGLLDSRTLEWDLETLDVVGASAAALPALVDFEPTCGLLPEWRRRWPELAEAAWFPAVGDGACANLGAGGIGSRLPGLTIGTSAAARVLWASDPEEEIPGDLWCYRLDVRHRVAGGALSNGGNGLSFLRASFPELDLAELDATLRTAAPGVHELVAIPSLFPERGVGWTEIESGSLVGLRPGTTPLQIATVWLEAIAQRLAELVERLERRFGAPTEVRASGGALQVLPGWTQTIADAAGVPVRRSAEPEATSRGAALVAARGLGWIQSLESLEPPAGELVKPNPSHRQPHREALARQHEVAQAIRRTATP